MPTDPANNYLPIETDFKQDGYHIYLNDGFDKLAKHRRAAGALADRPAPGQEFAPKWYYATDDNNGTEYYNAGTEWQRLPTVRYPNGDTGAHIQAAIDEAAVGSGCVALNPAITYSINNEIHLKSGVTLQCNYAQMNVLSDVNGIFCDTNTHIQDLRIDVATGGVYNSSVVLLDSGRAGKGYGLGGQDKNCWISGQITGARDNGVGLHLISDNSYGISLTNRFVVTIDACDRGIVLDAAGGWINSPMWQTDMVRCRIFIDAIGTTENTFYGSMQPQPGYSATAIRNDGVDQRTISWHGMIWDTHRFTEGTVLVGPYIFIFNQNVNNIYNASHGSDGSENQIGFGFRHGRMRFYDYGNNQLWGWDVQNGRLVFTNDYRQPMIEYDPNGTVAFGDISHPTLPVRDITTVVPDHGGELCIATAGSSPQGHFTLCFAKDASTWVSLDGTEVTPIP